MTDREQYTPGPASGAQIQKDGEKWTLVLVRDLRHSPEKVWQGLPIRRICASGLPSSRWEPGSGWNQGEAHHGGGAHAARYRNKGDASRRPQRAGVQLGAQDIRWELEALGGGTRLTLWHNIDRRFISMGAAGWHICFDVLDRLLGGTPIGRAVGPTP